MRSDWNAYVAEDYEIQPTGTGRLAGMKFAAKDVFAIRGWTNTAGNPDWHRSHEPAEENADVIEMLLQRGAALRGITHTDELMYSLSGENAHYGTPVNPVAPDRIPGGSSSGSAVSAAAGLADFALGTDTGGSVRVPSAYCGISGFRPSHGLVSTKGVVPLAPSFDTVGWMSGDTSILLEVGMALLPSRDKESLKPSMLLECREAFELADEACQRTLSRFIPALEHSGSGRKSVRVAPEGLYALYETFRTIQGYEIWQTHGDWISRVQPRLGPDIAERIAWTRTLTGSDYERQLVARSEFTKRIEELLGDDDGLIVLPTVPGGPPRRGASGDRSRRNRVRVMQLCCLAGLAGLPQVTVPVAMAGGKPAAISFIAGRGRDLQLLRWVHGAMPSSRLS